MNKRPYVLNKINSYKDFKNLDVSDLPLLAEEIRAFLINNISKIGGHLASNLGVVELVLAINYVMDFESDKIVYDVGHQSYIQKIITGRKKDFSTLRQEDGLSGFPKRSESKYDFFDTGHSSTSISAAIGMAIARDLGANGFTTRKENIIALIGDGALTGGMAYEALNHAGEKKEKLIVILNDNDMSIGKNIGAVQKHLTNLRSNKGYKWFSREINESIPRIPLFGKMLLRLYKYFKRVVKFVLLPGVIFENMGYTYFGPYNGHNIDELIKVLKKAKTMNKPVFIHTVTKKGNGYAPAEENPEIFHSSKPFDIKTGTMKTDDFTTFSCACGDKLIDLARKDKNVVAITAAMKQGTGLCDFEKEFPDRLIDVAIAEQHAVTMAAGMAAANLKPYVTIYSTFLQRAYDQILHDVAMQNLPVVFLLDRAGLIGADGETHQGVFDLSYLGHMPNMNIWAPKSIDEFSQMMEYSLNFDYPLAIRYCKGKSYDLEKTKFSLSWEILADGEDICIFAVGRSVSISLDVSKKLKETGIDVKVVNARIVKPLDTNTLQDCKAIKNWITIEENMKIGGFGSMVNNYLRDNELDNNLKIFGVNDVFVNHANIPRQLETCSIDESAIINYILKIEGRL